MYKKNQKNPKTKPKTLQMTPCPVSERKDSAKVLSFNLPAEVTLRRWLLLSDSFFYISTTILRNHFLSAHIAAVNTWGDSLHLASYSMATFCFFWNQKGDGRATKSVRRRRLCAFWILYIGLFFFYLLGNYYSFLLHRGGWKGIHYHTLQDGAWRKGHPPLLCLFAEDALHRNTLG